MYLLDTSVVSVIFNAQAAKHAQAIAFRNSIGDDKIVPSVSVVTLSEMRFGLEVFALRTPPPDRAALDLVRQRIAKAAKLDVLPVTEHIAYTHGQMRAKWANHIAPRRLAQGKLKGIPPERWIVDWPAATLQITENDLWIAATALTHDFTLVTLDGDFERLKVIDKLLRVDQL